jgi:hypothetical protein
MHGSQWQWRFIMLRTIFGCLVALTLGLPGVACSDDDTGGGGDTDAINEVGDQGIDPLTDPDGEADPIVDPEPDPQEDVEADGDEDPVEDAADAWVSDVPLAELPIQVPEVHTFTCEDAGTDLVEITDPELVCQFQYGDIIGVAYVQATPVSLNPLCVPQFEAGAASIWVHERGVLTQVNGTYDWGGRHHNPYFTFEYQDLVFKYHSSSTGFGFHACAPPDCLIVCDDGTTCTSEDEAIEDGCQREAGGPPPSIPMFCVEVNADGTVPPFVDLWTLPETTWGALPCRGDLGSILW